MNESALVFDGAGETLVGVLAAAADGVAPSGWGVLIVVGGPQYRVGAHRQFVQLARALAAAGHASLRFDYRGMGDSSGELRGFEHVSADIGAAVAALRAQAPEVRRVAVFGLCDAASAALLHLHDVPDAGIDALCLLNPWVRSEATLARTHLKHYYLQRLKDPAFWRKLARGGVGLGRAGELLQSMGRAWRPARGAQPAAAARPPFQAAMARAWRAFRRPVLLVVCGDDLTAQEFLEHAAADPAWRGLLAADGVQRLDLPAADHTLSAPSERKTFEAALCRWLAAA